jgi:hypothetical protein
MRLDAAGFGAASPQYQAYRRETAQTNATRTPKIF